MSVGIFYVLPRFGSWSGSTANLGTEDAPFLHAWHLRTALGNGTVSPGSTIIFMCEYGPITLAELTASDTWRNTAKTITQALAWTQTLLTDQGGIVLGSHYNGTSNCRDMLIQFRGDIPWHIDARGATSNNERMRAALTIQGVRNRVEGLRMAQPNWNWMNNERGVGQGLAGTGTYAQETSDENHGLVFHGGWGCSAADCDVWGSDAYGRTSIDIRLASLDTSSQPNSTTVIERCNTWGADQGQQIGLSALLANGGLPFPDRYLIESGATAEIRHGRAWDARWGDTATIPAVNNSMMHGQPVRLGAGIWLRGAALVHHMEVYGICQDAIELVGINQEVSDCHVHDTNPHWTDGQTVLRWTNSGGTWVQTTTSIVGEGIKLGLGGETGQIAGSVWPSSGTAGGSSNLPAVRNRALRNRVHTSTPHGTAAGITTNGANGCLIAANEVTGFVRSYKMNLSGLAGTENLQHYFVNNYGAGGTVALELNGYLNVWVWNNIFDGSSADISSYNAVSGTIWGGKNRLVRGNSTYNAITNAMQGNTTGAADYVVGAGPIAGGNCASSGSLAGQIGAAAAGALVSMSGAPLGRVVGPRAV